MVDKNLKNLQPLISVENLCKNFNLEFFSGNIKEEVCGLASVTNIEEKKLTFLYDNKSIDLLSKKKHYICITTKTLAKQLLLFKNNKTLLLSDSPKKVFFKIVASLFDKNKLQAFIHDSAEIDQSSSINKNVQINANCFIGKNVTIDSNTFIGSGVVLNNNVKIGKNCYIDSNTVISNSIILDDVKISSNCTIGKSGFGVEKNKNKLFKIPHIGLVKIGNFCDIGSGCTIDRGTLDNTILGDYVFLDNQCHIAHNVAIGDNTIIAAQTAVSGSSKIGKNCVIGGQVGIKDHIIIVDNVKISSKSGVTKDLKSSETYSGFPAVPSRKFWKNEILARKNRESLHKSKTNN